MKYENSIIYPLTDVKIIVCWYYYHLLCPASLANSYMRLISLFDEPFRKLVLSIPLITHCHANDHVFIQ